GLYRADEIVDLRIRIPGDCHAELEDAAHGRQFEVVVAVGIGYGRSDVRPCPDRDDRAFDRQAADVVNHTPADVPQDRSGRQEGTETEGGDPGQGPDRRLPIVRFHVPIRRLRKGLEGSV